MPNKIPFGDNLPNDQQKVLLKKLGFNTESLTRSNLGHYELAVPDTPRVSIKIDQEDFDRFMYHVMYNQEEVISIHQKTAVYGPFVQFMMEPEATIDRALEKSNQISEAQMRQYNEENGFSHANVNSASPPESTEQSIMQFLAESLKRGPR